MPLNMVQFAGKGRLPINEIAGSLQKPLVGFGSDISQHHIALAEYLNSAIAFVVAIGEGDPVKFNGNFNLALGSHGGNNLAT